MKPIVNNSKWFSKNQGNLLHNTWRELSVNILIHLNDRTNQYISCVPKVPYTLCTYYALCGVRYGIQH